MSVAIAVGVIKEKKNDIFYGQVYAGVVLTINKYRQPHFLAAVNI